MKSKLCQKHANSLVKKSSIKILRFARKCNECMAQLQTGNKQMCEKHDQLYNDWEKKQIASIKCEECV